MCSIFGIKWQDLVSNEEVLKTASLPSIESILLQVQLCLADHVTRMEDICMPNVIFSSELQEGKRSLMLHEGINHQSWLQEPQTVTVGSG